MPEVGELLLYQELENYGFKRALRKASLGLPLILQMREPRPEAVGRVLVGFLQFLLSLQDGLVSLPNPERLRGFLLPTLEGARAAPVALPAP